MLADPGLVIVQAVEVNQKLHVAIESEQRVFIQRMKGSEKNPCLQKPVVHRPRSFFRFSALLTSIVAITGRLTRQGFMTGGIGSGRHFARQQSSGSNVRFGSKADIGARPRNVRFTPKSTHSPSPGLGCLRLRMLT